MDTDIIIPIYNAFDFTKKCIETVIEHTDLTKHTLLLINDKSTDQRILPLLTLFTTEYPSLNITIINNESNQGFVRTVNIGMQHSSRDVVLLNSDTEVTKNWLPKIQKCAYSKAAIATVTPLSNNATLASVPDFMSENTIPSDFTIEEYAEIEAYTFSSMPSPHMTFKTMLELSEFSKELLNREDIDGVVITHGTDTLEETAYLLDLTINSDKPVVITGAMRSGSELGYDGPSNLAASICTAISDDAKGRGVLVCFNGELNSAAEVTKANSMALNAFITPNFGPIGIVDNNKVMFYRDAKKTETYDAKEINKDVLLIKCVADMDSTLIDFAIEKGFGGIVIEALGRGNVPPRMVEGIKRALDNKMPIVVVSRCFEGRVHESYGYEGGGKMLKDLGVIFGDTLPGQKARVKLSLAINSNISYDEIKNQF
mgnify:CR=1 FL=1